MGLIICDKHGEQGIVINIEDAICRKILADAPIAGEDLCVMKVLFYDNDEFLMDMNYLMTSEMKGDLNLMEVYEVRNDEEDSEFLRLISPRMGIVCGQCLNEYKYKADIKAVLRKFWTYMQG